MRDARAAAPETLPAAEPRLAEALNLQSLTGLRIFAALAVYVSHLPPLAGAPAWAHRAMSAGYYGVTIFFVLSGFVLALNYWDRLASPNGRGLRSFMVARFARVYPLYLLVLGYLVLRAAGDGELVPGDWPLHVLGLQAWHPDVAAAFRYGPGWSVSVELFLYATLPVLIPLLRPLDRSTARLLALAAVTVAVMVAAAWWFQSNGRGDLPLTDPESAHRYLYRLPAARLGDFVLGIVAARLCVRWRGGPGTRRVGAWAATSSLLLIALVALLPDAGNLAYRWDVAYAVPAAVGILGLALAPTSPLAVLLATGPVVFLGEASYAFYLVHLTAARYFGAGAWSREVSTATIALEVLALGATIALAVGLHVGVERPARLHVRSRLDPPREETRGPAPVASLAPGPVCDPPARRPRRAGSGG